MRKLLFVPLIIFAVILVGCTNRNMSDFIAAIPEVQSFMSQNPGAEIKVVFLSQSIVNDSIQSIRDACGQQMEKMPYYYATITQGDNFIKVYLDENASRVMCMIKPAVNQTTGEGNESADNGQIIVTEGNNTTSNNTEKLFGQKFTADQTLQIAEEKLQGTVCDSLPTTATRMAGQLQVDVLIPGNLQTSLGVLGDTLTFRYYITSSNNDTYYTGGWVDGGHLADSSQAHVMIIPISADLTDANGNKIATEQGGITLTFEGPLADLQKDAPYVCPGGGDCPVPKPAICSPYCHAQPVPTYTRTNCEVNFEKSCPTKSGSVLCGQCHYSDFFGHDREDSGAAADLGKCMYCPSGSTCNWGIEGICGDWNYLGSGSSSSPTIGQTYYVSCSQCSETPLVYSYRGYNYAFCNYYYNVCVQSGCGRILDNCR